VDGLLTNQLTAVTLLGAVTHPPTLPWYQITAIQPLQHEFTYLMFIVLGYLQPGLFPLLGNCQLHSQEFRNGKCPGFLVARECKLQWWCVHRFCPRCRLHCRATKEMSLWRLPRILVVHLKRFSFANFLLRDKIEDLVEFPLRWDVFLSPGMASCVVYLEYFLIAHCWQLLGTSESLF